MLYCVYDAGGVLHCRTFSWPVARACLDWLILNQPEATPKLTISQGEE